MELENGPVKLSPKIHYQENRNPRKLACTIQNRILPMMPDSNGTMAFCGVYGKTLC